MCRPDRSNPAAVQGDWASHFRRRVAQCPPCPSTRGWIEAADHWLDSEFDREEMLRLLLAGLSSANPNCEERPAMRRVVQVLNGEADPVPVPRKKPLLVFSSSASIKIQEMAFSCGDDVRGGYPAAAKPASSPQSEGADIER